MKILVHSSYPTFFNANCKQNQMFHYTTLKQGGKLNSVAFLTFFLFKSVMTLEKLVLSHDTKVCFISGCLGILEALKKAGSPSKT